MALKQSTTRTVAVMVAGGSMALVAAQAGVVPGVHVTTAGLLVTDPPVSAMIEAVQMVPASTTGATETPTPADAAFVPDGFARMQAHFLPPASGFAEPPGLVSTVVDADFGTDAFLELASLVPPALPEAPDTAPEVPVTGSPLEFSPLGLPCGFDLAAEPMPGAMIALDVSAPCHPDTVVTVSHSGLTFTARTGVVGLLTLDLPALERAASVSVRLEDGTERSLSLDVPDLDRFERVALAFPGTLGMELHALEGGAAWMSVGHVRPGAPRAPEAAEADDGFLTLLGDTDAPAPLLAQVYTRPVSGDAAAVTVDAPITEATCGSVADAHLLHSLGGRLEETRLGFTYPGCDAVGDTLVLQNLVGQPRLAAN
jgi:hypothetical protein